MTNTLIYSGEPLFTGKWEDSRTSREHPPGKVTLQVSRKQAELIIGSALCAYRRGTPLNRHITINWSQAGIVDSCAARQTGEFLKKVADRIKYWGGEFAATWVRENGIRANRLRSGTHVHILAHIPINHEQRYFSLQRRLLKDLSASGAYRGKTLKTRPVKGRALSDGPTIQSYAKNLCDVVSYQLKSVQPIDMAELGLTKRHRDGGRIVGKRCGTTQNIGKGAQALAGLSPDGMTLPALSQGLIEWI